MITIDQGCVERFLRYVSFDTQSSEESASYPSTEKQKLLGRQLVEELREMGLTDAGMDDWGYVTATLPANVSHPVPVIGLIAHMDTSPEVSGADVKPIIHKNYQGGDLVLPSSVVIRAEETPELARQIGNDLITSDGSTLLGADNKAGIAEIISAVGYLIDHPEIPHGRLRIAVTPDEEVGRGTEHFDVQAFGADFAYTIDGETLGEVEDETFCADSVTMTISGVNLHPGYARGKLVNAIKIAARIIASLPQDALSPETTSGREGYLHPHRHSRRSRYQVSHPRFYYRGAQGEGEPAAAVGRRDDEGLPQGQTGLSCGGILPQHEIRDQQGATRSGTRRGGSTARRDHPHP